MFQHKKIQNLNDFFKNQSERESAGVYFYRIRRLFGGDRRLYPCLL